MNSICSRLVTQPMQTGAWVPGWSLTLGRAWLRQKCRVGTPRDHRPARLQENDCQFGLVSADCMPRRDSTAVIKQFSGERYCFKLPKRPVYFMSTLLTHTSTQTCATHRPRSPLLPSQRVPLSPVFLVTWVHECKPGCISSPSQRMLPLQTRNVTALRCISNYPWSGKNFNIFLL